jgi:elongation factor P--beta-lysine ligase
LEYIEKLASHTLQDYYLVQERHYAKGDPRIAAAKIVLPVQNDFPIQPSRGETLERAGETVVDVWTMYIMGRDLANQYVEAFNADIQLAREWQQKNKE